MFLDFNTAKIGDNFSLVKGSSTPTLLQETKITEVYSGTSNPASLAIQYAGLPTITGFNLALTFSFQMH